MAYQWPPKDVDDILDYEIDWSSALEGDVVTSSGWTTSPSGLTKSSESIAADGGSTKVWLAAGTAGITYTIINTIGTRAGRAFSRSVTLTVSSL